MYEVGELFLLSVLLGAFFAFLYDILRFARMLRPLAKARVWFFVNIFGDIFFLFLLSLIFCVFLYLTNDGDFRALVLLGNIVGFALYYNSVGVIFTMLAHKMTYPVKRTVGKLVCRVFAPLLLLAKKLFKLIKKRISMFRDLTNKKKKHRKGKKIGKVNIKNAIKQSF